jgi:metal-responsive CopG/Arc/MetJ family transcriptional regulator
MARPTTYDKRVQTSIRLPADLLEAIQETADEWVMGRNLLIERLLRMALDRLDVNVDPLEPRAVREEDTPQ